MLTKASRCFCEVVTHFKLPALYLDNSANCSLSLAPCLNQCTVRGLPKAIFLVSSARLGELWAYVSNGNAISAPTIHPKKRLQNNVQETGQH